MLNELLKQKFTSGNDVPVTSVRVTRAEYEQALQVEQVPTVPEGWKLVPVEITEEMSAAFMEVHCKGFHPSGESIYRPAHTCKAVLGKVPEFGTPNKCCHKTVLVRCKGCPYETST